MALNRPSPGTGIVPFCERLLQASECRLHREMALVQRAVQERCDEIYDTNLAALGDRYGPDEAKRIALDRVRAYRASCRPRLDEAKRVVLHRKQCRDELVNIFQDYCLWSSRFATAS